MAPFISPSFVHIFRKNITLVPSDIDSLRGNPPLVCHLLGLNHQELFVQGNLH